MEAIEAYRAAAAARPNFGDAYWSLANLKTYRFADSEISRMRAEEAAPAKVVVDRYHLCFALGKAFEDRGEYAQSWGYYAQGNALKREESRYRPETVENGTRPQIATCTREFCSPCGRRCAETRVRFIATPSGSTARAGSRPAFLRRGNPELAESHASCSSCRVEIPTIRATRVLAT